MIMIKRKQHPKFSIPNFGAKSRKRVQSRWRKQRGIDNKKRIKKDFMGAEPNIGYGNPASLKHVRASGKKLAIIHNMSELMKIQASSDAESYEVAIAHEVSSRKRHELVDAARGGKVRIVNVNSGMK